MQYDTAFDLGVGSANKSQMQEIKLTNSLF